VPGELLFMVGYSQQRSSFNFGTLHCGASPYVTQTTDLPPDKTDPQYHFAIHYRPDRSQSDEPRPRPQPNPPGLSGSPVWNTRYIEYATSARTWTPDAAQLTGLVWGWRETCLLVTKVDHLGLLALSRRSRGL
jgi:hypothetical protein